MTGIVIVDGPSDRRVDIGATPLPAADADQVTLSARWIE